MTYGNMDQVKMRLQVDDDFVEWDNRINDALTRADNWINAKLKTYTGVPLSSPDLIISDIAADYAAGVIQEEGSTNPTANSTPGVPNKLRTRAEKTLNDYIRTTFGVDPEADIMKGTVLGSVHVSASDYMTDEMQAEWPD
jgi:hypothetical protein